MLQWKAEVDAFTEFIVRQGVRNVLEIGTGPGGFIDHLGTVTDGVLVSVDLPSPAISSDPTGLTHGACLIRNGLLQRRHPRFRGILGDSHSGDVFREVASSFEGLVDLLFLDGDDSFAGKQQDFIAYAQLVRDGGWIATHDIASHGLCGVPLFWSALKTECPEHYEFIEPGHPWGGIGVIRWSR